MSVPLHVLTRPEEVESFCRRVGEEPFITIDTEFVREKTYWPNLCLVQIGAARETGLIDCCTEDLDLSPLRDLLRRSGCRKVFHAARQDVEIFYHLFGEMPENLFDTQIAAQVAGFGDQIGYARLVSTLLGKEIDKGHRFSDWAHRPLSAEQIQYAAGDVIWLRPVYEKLLAQLVREGRLPWIEEDMRVLTDPALYSPDPMKLWEKFRPRTHNRRALGALRELAAWRERRAQEADLPRQRILRDEALLQIATLLPSSSEKLARIRGLAAGWERSQFAREVLDILKKVADLLEKELPRTPGKGKSGADGLPPGSLALLKVLLEVCAETHKVAPRMIASLADLEGLGGGDSPLMSGWRYDLFGKTACALLRGELALGLEERQIVLLPRAPGSASGRGM